MLLSGVPVFLLFWCMFVSCKPATRRAYISLMDVLNQVDYFAKQGINFVFFFLHFNTVTIHRTTHTHTHADQR